MIRRFLLTAVACAGMVLGLALAPQSSAPTLDTASAADLSQFNPGMIISDAVFYNAGAMSAAQVQSFLVTKGASCNPSAGNTCLKDYTQATTTRSADAYCAAYQGVADETAAQIIAKVAAACGINPQVLIVTLQKEQGLITSTTGKSAATYQKALGFGCPDTAPCDAQYYGFGNQVYLAARQFKVYAANPTRYAHRAGMTNNVRFHPNSACGTSAVYIQNQATASLYNYTPYQPNAAALAAGYGTGDSCSSYGNRNFWNYFTDWFGAVNQTPVGALDSVVSPSIGTISVSGWALDPDTTTSITVHVYVDGKAVAALKADKSRPDVGTAYGKGDNHGFSGTVAAAGGTHQVCLWAIDSDGGSNPQIGCSTVTVNNKPPIGAFDSATSVEGQLRVRGWTLDPDTTASIRAHVYVDGKAVASIAADGNRPDVNTAYGKGAAHGFDTVVPATAGSHQVCVYGIDATGGPNTQLGCRTVTIVNAVPIGAFDSAQTGLEKFTIKGWALDPDVTRSVQVHVYVDGKATRSILADGNRPDVNAAYGMGAAHGFEATLSASVGSHEVCLYAIDTWGGKAGMFGCRTVEVNGKPYGALDTATSPARNTVQVTGWAIDPNTTDPISVHVYVDGSPVKSVPANTARPDVDAAYGMGPLHGYSTTVSGIASGRHTICTWALDSWGAAAGGVNPQLGCLSVTVQ